MESETEDQAAKNGFIFNSIFKCGNIQMTIFYIIIGRKHVHVFLVLITCTQKPPINPHAEISSGARILNFALSLHLHPYSLYTSSKGSGKAAHMCRLIRALVA